ncbi:hypothetical protein EV127DRAFT_413454 [Xylaria flabelliformis]|nr:hypothetical protein EV127DRAFT_413454 [Xylaria flabelliformis]
MTNVPVGTQQPRYNIYEVLTDLPKKEKKKKLRSSDYITTQLTAPATIELVRMSNMEHHHDDPYESSCKNTGCDGMDVYTIIMFGGLILLVALLLACAIKEVIIDCTRGEGRDDKIVSKRPQPRHQAKTDNTGTKSFGEETPLLGVSDEKSPV